MSVVEEAQAAIATRRHELAVNEAANILKVQLPRARARVESLERRLIELNNGAEPEEYDRETGDRLPRVFGPTPVR